MDVSAELLPCHAIDVLVATGTDQSIDVRNGEPVGFRCRECGAVGASVFEIVHDESCSLAGRHGGETADARPEA